MNSELTVQEKPNAFAIHTLEQARDLAKDIADSGCFGIKKPSQAITIMMIAQSEGVSFAQALKKYHVFETGQLSQRSDYTQADFESRYKIIWHARSAEMVAASFFKTNTITDDARARAKARFKAQYELDAVQLIEAKDRDRKRELELIEILADLSHEGEATIIRTIYDAEVKGITKSNKGTKANWLIGAANMLQWRCVSDGVKLIDPGAYAFSMDSDIQDVRALEAKQQEETARLAYDPKSRDREAMQAILDEHLRNAEEATTTAQRQHYQGLASEMRVKIADLDTKPAIIAETTVIPPGGSELPDDQLPGVKAASDWRRYVIKDVKTFEGRTLGDLSAQEISTLYEKRFKYAEHPRFGEEVKWITRAYMELFPSDQ